MYVLMLSCGLGIFFAFFSGFWEPVQKGGDVDKRDLGGDNKFFFSSLFFFFAFFRRFLWVIGDGNFML
jgi:hypothetical protein